MPICIRMVRHALATNNLPHSLNPLIPGTPLIILLHDGEVMYSTQVCLLVSSTLSTTTISCLGCLGKNKKLDVSFRRCCSKGLARAGNMKFITITQAQLFSLVLLWLHHQTTKNEKQRLIVDDYQRWGFWQDFHRPSESER